LLNSKRTILLGILTLILTCILSCPTIEDLELQYFITQVTYQRQPWLCCEIGRHALRTAINQVRATRPFAIDAFVLLPDHFHCLWTLPQNDSDVSTRLRLIKTYVTRHYGTQLGLDVNVSDSRRKRKERNLWQRRFWDI
jgi:putative transposase